MSPRDVPVVQSQAKVAIGTRGRVNDTVPEQVRDGYIVTDLETENRIKALCRNYHLAV
ncbi:hypothetical protein QTP88_019015 [Uroleucon formosanum]